MPTGVVRSKFEEKHWRHAKRIATKEGRPEDYPYIMGIFKRMVRRNPSDIANPLLALLLALRTAYQYAHWNATNHADHLLFERLYTSLDEDIDTLAEVADQPAVPIEAPHPTSAGLLEAENTIISLAKTGIGVEDAGLENYLLGLIEHRERGKYLLKQRSKENPVRSNPAALTRREVSMARQILDSEGATSIYAALRNAVAKGSVVAVKHLLAPYIRGEGFGEVDPDAEDDADRLARSNPAVGLKPRDLDVLWAAIRGELSRRGVRGKIDRKDLPGGVKASLMRLVVSDLVEPAAAPGYGWTADWTDGPFEVTQSGYFNAPGPVDQKAARSAKKNPAKVPGARGEVDHAFITYVDLGGNAVEAISVHAKESAAKARAKKDGTSVLRVAFWGKCTLSAGDLVPIERATQWSAPKFGIMQEDPYAQKNPSLQTNPRTDDEDAQLREVGNLILSQIGRGVRMRLGFNGLLYGAFMDVDGVRRVGIQAKASGANIQRGGYVRVLLDVDSDTYNVWVYTLRNRGMDINMKAHYTGIYADQLGEVIERVFG